MNNMHKILLIIILFSSLSTIAQGPVETGFMNYVQRENFANDPGVIGAPRKNWFLTTYTGFSAGFHFINGVSATVIAAPLGLQLNRRINENLYAFAGISITPAYINFSPSYLNSAFNKGDQRNGMFDATHFRGYSRAEMGLMYVNDAKTFSISGSVGVQTSSYPLIPYQQTAGSNTRNLKH